MTQHFIVNVEEANSIIDHLMNYCQFGVRHESELPCPSICPAGKYCNFKKEVNSGSSIHRSRAIGTQTS